MSASTHARSAPPRVAVGKLAATTSPGRVAHRQVCAGRRRTSPVAWKAREKRMSETCQGGSCLDTLRNSSAWRSWIRTIRDYALSDGASGALEAFQLADSMEEYGCEFTRTFEFGGCFNWAPHLGWEFKTVEFFCPQSCECELYPPEWGGLCPQPFGFDCRYVQSNCITVNRQHYCLGRNAEVVRIAAHYVAYAASSLVKPCPKAVRCSGPTIGSR